MTTVETTDLRVLTVKQPWASLIASGVKRIENRTWTTRYRGPVAIHASLGREPKAPDMVAASLRAVGIEATAAECDLRFGLSDRTLPAGVIVGVVDLVDVVPAAEVPAADGAWVIGPYCWILRPIPDWRRRFRLPGEPIRGKLGLWRL
jgi:hypothetical protein